MHKRLNILKTRFKDLYVIENNNFKDNRGVFSRIFSDNELNQIFNSKIKEINFSRTEKKGTVRGLHFQHEPYAEVKIIKCIKGGIFDIVVDIRKNSSTFLSYFTIELNDKNNKMIFVPKGFAHGFQTLEDSTEILYLHSNNYNPESEGGLNIYDEMLAINLPLKVTNISEKDKSHKFLTKSFIGI